MRRCVLVLSALVAAGCHADPCDGVAATCVSLYVDRAAGVTQLDELALHVAVADASYDKTASSGRFVLPANLALVFDSFPDGVVTVDITAIGTSGGALVVDDDVQSQLRRGQHASLHLTPGSSNVLPDLAAPGAGGDAGSDLATGAAADLATGAAADLATGSLADLATTSVADLATSVGSDLAGNACNACPSSACFGGQCNKRVFVTSTLQPSNLGGLAGADAVCQQLADSAGLGGTYRAWLSDATGSPSTRFTQSSSPYVLVDGTRVADNWAGLVSGTLRHAISLTEKKTTPPTATAGLLCCTSGTFVWSNTTAQGALYTSAASCGNWGASGGTGSAFGMTDTVNTWSFGCSGADCTAQAAIYCVEQ